MRAATIETDAIAAAESAPSEEAASRGSERMPASQRPTLDHASERLPHPLPREVTTETQ
jgi:hypothetical protein